MNLHFYIKRNNNLKQHTHLNNNKWPGILKKHVHNETLKS